jgi:cytochrome P450
MLERPSAPSTNPIAIMARDLRRDHAATVAFPPGELRFSLRRTNTYMRDPLPFLLDAYERFGPIFTMKIFHHNVVFMLGPEANHHILVSNADNFSWREGHLRDLIPLLGDGLLTTDGAYHRGNRMAMVPMFHKERIAASLATIQDEVDRAVGALVPGAVIDVSVWARELALRVAMRALFGFDPDAARAGGLDAAHEFETALAFHGEDLKGQLLRGPFSPFGRLLRARARLDELLYSEIDRRRESGERGPDLLSLLLDVTDEDGDALDRRQVRDQVMTLLFAGHDTTTSTVAFLLWELAQNPALAEDPQLNVAMLIDETLRKYPPAYTGPRRSIEPFEFGGHRVPGGVHVHYSSWASHHLAHVFPDPERFDPYRFTPQARAALPKGAYVPFGAGSRTCIGMRFAEAEIAIIARAILERFRLEALPGYELTIRHSPTISPAGGLPMTVRSAAPARVLDDAREPAAA